MALIYAKRWGVGAGEGGRMLANKAEYLQHVHMMHREDETLVTSKYTSFIFWCAYIQCINGFCGCLAISGRVSPSHWLYIYGVPCAC